MTLRYTLEDGTWIGGGKKWARKDVSELLDQLKPIATAWKQRIIVTALDKRNRHLAPYIVEPEKQS